MFEIITMRKKFETKLFQSYIWNKLCLNLLQAFQYFLGVDSSDGFKYDIWTDEASVQNFKMFLKIIDSILSFLKETKIYILKIYLKKLKKF